MTCEFTLCCKHCESCKITDLQRNIPKMLFFYSRNKEHCPSCVPTIKGSKCTIVTTRPSQFTTNKKRVTILLILNMQLPKCSRWHCCGRSTSTPAPSSPSLLRSLNEPSQTSLLRSCKTKLRYAILTSNPEYLLPIMRYRAVMPKHVWFQGVALRVEVILHNY